MSDTGTENTARAGENPEPKNDGDAPKTFSQEELDRVVGERLARERAKYADYDEIKAQVTDLTEKLAQRDTEIQTAVKRAEDAEAATQAATQKVAEREAEDARKTMLAEIAESMGVPAKALRGTTREELEAHATEIKALLGEVPVGPTSSATDRLNPTGTPAESAKPGIGTLRAAYAE